MDPLNYMCVYDIGSFHVVCNMGVDFNFRGPFPVISVYN
jgi:hypothetical protein